jgi:endoglucanase
MAEVLKTLSKIPGVSGHEDELAAVFQGIPGVEVRTDVMGSVIAIRRGTGPEPRPRIMLAAHCDEIGLMVTKVEEGGFLRFVPVGGVDPRVLPGQAVMVYGKRAIPGFVGFTPPHLVEPGKEKETVPMHELYIDTGNEAGDIQVGDVCTFDSGFTRLGPKRAAGKAMDDRAGVAVLLGCLEELGHMRHQADVYLAATVQEEVGFRGAITCTYDIVPDIGVAVDVTHGAMPGLPEYDTHDLGKGPTITLGGNIHPVIHKTLVEVAEAEGIPYQLEAMPGSTGTDAWAMQVCRAGVPSGLVSVPLRYMHTPVETLELKDAELASRLLARFALRVDRVFLEGLSWN